MPFVPVPGAYQVNIRMRLQDQLVENVFGVRSDDGEAPLSMADIANVFLDWWSTELAPQVSDQLILHEIQVRDLASEDAGSYLLTPEGTVTGTAGGGSAPNNVAFCVTAKTASVGRSARGRTYIPGVPKGLITISTVSSGWASAVVAAMNQLLTLLEPINAVNEVISRIHAGVERLTGLTTVVVRYAAFDMTVDSQRRRLPGRGA